MSIALDSCCAWAVSSSWNASEFVQIVYVVLKQIIGFSSYFRSHFPPELNFDAMRRRSARDEYHTTAYPSKCID
jgi:hypothetical protein